MIAQRRISIRENDALLAQVFLQRTVNNFALKLSLHAGEILLLCLRNTQLVERFFKLGRDIIPGRTLLLGRIQIVVDAVKVDSYIATPARHWLRLEALQRAQPELANP